MPILPDFKLSQVLSAHLRPLSKEFTPERTHVPKYDRAEIIKNCAINYLSAARHETQFMEWMQMQSSQPYSLSTSRVTSLIISDNWDTVHIVLKILSPGVKYQIKKLPSLHVAINIIILKETNFPKVQYEADCF